MTRLHWIRAILLVLATAAHADPTGIAPWHDAAAGFTIAYPAPPGAALVSAAIQYPQNSRVPISEDRIELRRDSVSISVPAAEKPHPGLVTLEISWNTGARDQIQVPVSYRVEIDITGPAAESLLTELPDENYLVDYIPCCNIYGGLLIAERIPVNPWRSDAGLPRRVLSDFVTLEPDGLTASTMGLHFEFGYPPELEAAQVGLYEWGINEWREVFAYDVNEGSGRVRFHCPTGGTFVIAEKPLPAGESETN